MCGRYVLFADPDLKEIREIIEEVQRKKETFKTGEIFPADRAPILIQKQNRVTPESVAWGFPHRYNKGTIINLMDALKASLEQHKGKPEPKGNERAVWLNRSLSAR